MNILLGTLLLWVLALVALRKLQARGQVAEAMAATARLLAFTLPRVAVALLGASFLAELMPEAQIEQLFGETAGVPGLVLAALLGALTPGGAFVSFAIGAAALKAGAAQAPVLSYVTAWGLFSVVKIFAYELPFLGGHALRMRLLVTWPIPLIVGAAGLLL